MGLHGRKYVEQYFDRRVIADSMENLLLDAAARRNTR